MPIAFPTDARHRTKQEFAYHRHVESAFKRTCRVRLPAPSAVVGKPETT